MAGTLLPMPRLYAFDANGDPLPGAKLSVFLAGTSTPTTTWADVDQLVPNSNPVIAGSDGVFGPIYLQPSLSYKVILTTSTDALRWSQDHITAVPGITTAPTVDNRVADVRLTLTSGSPVPSSDVTAATVVYVTPSRGNRIALYDGAAWNLRTLTETAINVPAVANTLYDVFAYDVSGAVTLETVAWTNDTTRATALALQDGIWVRSGAVTRRYLGTFRTTTVAGQTEDSVTKRYVWNYSNRVERGLERLETATSWTYGTAAFRSANNNTANQVAYIVGIAEVVHVMHLQCGASNSSATGGQAIRINADNTVFQQAGSSLAAINALTHLSCFLSLIPAIGHHQTFWEEFTGAGTTTFSGTAASSGSVSYGTAGLRGYIEG